MGSMVEVPEPLQLKSFGTMYSDGCYRVCKVTAVPYPHAGPLGPGPGRVGSGGHQQEPFENGRPSVARANQVLA